MVILRSNIQSVERFSSLTHINYTIMKPRQGVFWTDIFGEVKGDRDRITESSNKGYR